MKRVLFLVTALIVALLNVSAATYTVEQIPNVHVADSSQYVSNPDGILSHAAVNRMNAILRDVRRNTSAEVVAVAVDNIEGEDIDTFATELFSAWGVGKSDKDNGLLILMVKDIKRAALRTGYGLEGVLPDIICAKIIREKMSSPFRQGDYDGCMLGAVETVGNILMNPDVRDEILSGEEDADFAQNDDLDLKSFFKTVLGISAMIALILLGVLLLTLYNNRKRPNIEKYRALNNLKPLYLALTFFGLGIPAVASVPLLLMMKRLRNMPHKCPNCGTMMNKVDEVHDNDYLTPAQDTEEQIGTVDYDVWLCPNCGETDIEPYEKINSGYVRCEQCGGMTSRLSGVRVLREATTRHEGAGIKNYRCLNCGHVTGKTFIIPMLAAPVILGGGGGGRGFGGGGGSFGGGFGGGMTGGGGASGGL